MNTEPGMRVAMGLPLFDDDEYSERGVPIGFGEPSSNASSSAGTDTEGMAAAIKPPPSPKPPGSPAPERSGRPLSPVEPSDAISQLVLLCEPPTVSARGISISSACAPLLSAAVLYSEVGHARVLEAIEVAQRERGRASRLGWMVDQIAAGAGGPTSVGGGGGGGGGGGCGGGAERNVSPTKGRRSSEDDDFIRSVSLRPGAARARVNPMAGAPSSGGAAASRANGRSEGRAERAARVTLAVDLLMLLNALIGVHADLAPRLKLRAEVVGLRMLHVLAELKETKHLDLVQQARRRPHPPDVARWHHGVPLGRPNARETLHPTPFLPRRLRSLLAYSGGNFRAGDAVGQPRDRRAIPC